ncbi:4-amino-4-deoxy-L-arabinose-phosphoundecaprenol flippase subunit ArnE [compost metagenome]
MLHILLVFYSFCGVFSKLASGYEPLSIQFILFYGTSIFILGFYAILWQQVLKHFSLTVAFMNKAVTVIWGVIWGFIFFDENITIKMVIGTIIVLIGICLVVKSDE